MAKQRSKRGAPANPVRATRTTPAMRGFYFLLGAIAVAGIAALSYLSTRPRGAVSQWDSTLPKLTAEGHLEGSDSAPLQVIEFGDYECPACGQFAVLNEPDVRTHLIDSGVVSLRFIDFPLNIHQNTWAAHRAAWCAGDQGKFWQMHDALYSRQDQWNGEATDKPEHVIAGIAQGLGLNMTQFNQCVDTRKYQAQIQANYTAAVDRHVDQTPTFVFGDKMIGGYETYDQFKANVDAAIAARKAAARAGGNKK
jgi:protein-disulfide isomerase